MPTQSRMRAQRDPINVGPGRELEQLATRETEEKPFGEEFSDCD